MNILAGIDTGRSEAKEAGG